jgi:serine/threonine protein kinase
MATGNPPRSTPRARHVEVTSVWTPREDLDGLDGLDGLDVLRELGKGAYSVVHLVRRKRGPGGARLGALKAIAQSLVRTPKRAAHVFAERSALRALSACPFVVALRDTFKDATHLYFLLECVGGGPLHRHLRGSMAPARGRFALSRAAFYAAEVLLALEACHAHDFAYRDLKGANVLLTCGGHVKLTDFGFAKTVKAGESTATYCGTPHAMAPEVVLCKVAEGRGGGCGSGGGYDKMVDWWSFGVLCYEMVVGRPPAGYVDSDELTAAILEGFPDASYPEDVFETDRGGRERSGHGGAVEDEKGGGNAMVRDGDDDGRAAKDLIQRCLCVNPNERLGIGRTRSSSAADDGMTVDRHTWLRAAVERARAWAKSGSAPAAPPRLDPRFFSVTDEDDTEEESTLTKAEQDMFACF